VHPPLVLRLFARPAKVRMKQGDQVMDQEDGSDLCFGDPIAERRIVETGVPDIQIDEALFFWCPPG
jgi:hypothetical protein